MYDRSLEYVHLSMCLEGLDNIMTCPVPGGFSIRRSRAGDEKHWARIETTAGEFGGEAEALKGFEKYYGADKLLLPERMYFITDETGIPAATASAWFNGRDGALHWVAVREDMQGKGLSKPIVSAALLRLRDLGYTRVTLSTQPPSWVAVKVYLEFGFRPVRPAAQKEYNGWVQVFSKLGTDFPEELCTDYRLP